MNKNNKDTNLLLDKDFIGICILGIMKFFEIKMIRKYYYELFGDEEE